MKRRKVNLLVSVSLVLFPGFAIGQSVEQINQCVELKKLSIKAEGDRQLIMLMETYKKGMLTFQSESAKNEFLRKLEALENEYSIRDAEALKDEVLKTKLKYMRREMTSCSGLDNELNQALTLHGIGQTLTELKQADDAVPVLQRCLAIKPDFSMCWLGLGEAKEALNRFSEAKDSYRKAIEMGGFDEVNAAAIRSAKFKLFILEHPGGDPMCAPGELGLKLKLDQCRAYLDAPPTEAGNATHSFGTGFFVNKDGYLLTNDHVVAGCRTISTRAGKPLQLVGRNSGSDLALLKTDYAPSSVAVLRTGPAPRPGDAVVAFGFPLPGILSSEGNVSTGVLSATSGLQNDVRFVQISAPVQGGNSGGPLFDSSGHVIGVVVAKLDALQVARETGDVPQNVNFAVHWSEVRAFLDGEGVLYPKEVSQRAISTSNIAATAAQIAVAIDCAR